MASVGLRGVSKHFGKVAAVDDISLEIPDGSFTVLVGPSGCGKTTTLRMVAGLEEVDAGEILIGDSVVNDVPPGERDIAMVFQNYALYPHMSVRENIGFGLRLRKTPKDEIRRRIADVADLLGIGELLDRKPRQLSGGQRQRVALGRAIARRPAVFLMDEPLSNLDAKLRAQTRAELIRLHHELGATFIYVTHDQVEATTMGEQVVVMNHGLIQQAAPPREIYLAPTNTFVAGFVGSPPMNLVPATAVRMDSGIGLNLGGAAIPVNGVLGRLLETVGPDRFTLGVRPEHVRIDAESGLRYRVEFVELMGHDTVVHLRGEGAPLLARVDTRIAPDHGAEVQVVFDTAYARLFDPATGDSLPC